MPTTIHRSVSAAVAAITMPAALTGCSADAEGSPADNSPAMCYVDWEFTAHDVAQGNNQARLYANYSGDGLDSSKTPNEHFGRHQKYSKVGNFKCSDAAKASHFYVYLLNPRGDGKWGLEKIKADIRLHNGNDIVRTVTFTSPVKDGYYRWKDWRTFPFDGSK
ncbi:hypothetical protein [Streptomyces halobius]|uniref:Lipoprotein n=1 Tax=Streptomyces halobius TaxID=2879846 RepID=A0ABY4M528_9ACTN|nr:hypothetical protein [Streptomyces halobius]UQA92869.1 hypothetical protein K9S39_14405 [Streptomyces halobius]